MQAKLIFQDGETIIGKSFGYEGCASGEIVFNTGMTGYPETLTDPSYKSQILICTYPLLGNYGVPDFNKEDIFGLKKYFESDSVHISALVVSEYSENYNHHEGETSLSQFLKEHKIPAITGVDTRYLTQKIREQGCMLGKVITGNKRYTKPLIDPNASLLSYQVCTEDIQIYGKGKKKICLIDMGVKNNIIRNLLELDTTVYRVPGNHNFLDDGVDYDGVFLSNGPGNPELYTQTIEHIKQVLKKDIPIFGICLGNQLLAIAGGGKTTKLPYGHRGQNQPVKDTISGKCLVTSQNHSFAINQESLPLNIKPWFTNLNDGTNEGIFFTNKNAGSVQFHPESSPGPNDSQYLFEKFISSL